jgi:hypothetical protein
MASPPSSFGQRLHCFEEKFDLDMREIRELLAVMNF